MIPTLAVRQMHSSAS